MSLRAFHFVFIIASILLCICLAIFAIANWQVTREFALLVFGIVTSALSVILTGYGLWFAKKSKKLIL